MKIVFSRKILEDNNVPFDLADTFQEVKKKRDLRKPVSCTTKHCFFVLKTKQIFLSPLLVEDDLVLGL